MVDNSALSVEETLRAVEHTLSSVAALEVFRLHLRDRALGRVHGALLIPLESSK